MLAKEEINGSVIYETEETLIPYHKSSVILLHLSKDFTYVCLFLVL